MQSSRDHTRACSAPPPLSDDALSAALDGDTPVEVEHHLRQCPGCAERLEQAGRLEAALAQSLNRWDCPPPEELADYHLGLLPPDQQRTITRHLTLCVRCSTEVEELRQFLTADAPEPITESMEAVPSRRVRTLVARLLPPVPLLQLRGVRGADRGPHVAQSDEATIILDQERDQQSMVRLRGQIADEMGRQARWNGALVALRQQGTVVATAFVDDAGGFLCGPIAASTSELRITAGDGTAIVIEELAL